MTPAKPLAPSPEDALKAMKQRLVALGQQKARARKALAHYEFHLGKANALYDGYRRVTHQFMSGIHDLGDKMADAFAHDREMSGDFVNRIAAFETTVGSAEKKGRETVANVQKAIEQNMALLAGTQKEAEDLIFHHTKLPQIIDIFLHGQGLPKNMRGHVGVEGEHPSRLCYNAACEPGISLDDACKGGEVKKLHDALIAFGIPPAALKYKIQGNPNPAVIIGVSFLKVGVMDRIVDAMVARRVAHDGEAADKPAIFARVVREVTNGPKAAHGGPQGNGNGNGLIGKHNNAAGQGYLQVTRQSRMGQDGHRQGG